MHASADDMKLSLALAAGFAVLALVAPASAQPATPAFNNNRWAENWDGSALAYKDIDLGNGAALDLGTDARWKNESMENPRFGLTSQGDDSWLGQRLMAHANVRFDDDARLFVEIGMFDVIGKSAKGGADDNRFDLQQGFLDLNHAFGDTQATLRMGRQEMVYTGDRFFDPGDSSTIRHHYDAVRLMLRNGDWRYDFFAGAPIRNVDGVWDDDVVDGTDFMGVQAERRAEALTTRFFLIDFTRDNYALSGTTAEDHRQTLGGIVIGQRGPYEYELELVRQFGDHGALDVNAWGGAFDVGRTFADAAWKPRIGARFYYGSGDSDPFDSKQETYAPPQPRGSWFSEGGFTAHANIFEAAATATLTPHEDWTVNLRLSGLWRPETADFVYASPNVALPGTRGGDAYIGMQPMAQIIWRIDRHIQLRSQFVYVDVSDRIEAAGGEDASYANISLALRY